MKRNFTKKNLHTGDIVECRNGERGVVILELDCILYQAGGLDIFEEAFTDDLFVDGPQREGDIFKVYHDPDGPLGFEKLFDLDPVFVRRNDKKTRERAAELSDKHDPSKGKAQVLVLEPCFRRYEKRLVGKRVPGPEVEQYTDVDIYMSEAPSMTANGEIGIDRTFVPVPAREGLYFIYNKHQEKRRLESEDHWGRETEKKPMVIIPEEGISIYSRCFLVRMNDSRVLEDLTEEDCEAAKKYFHEIEMR